MSTASRKPIPLADDLSAAFWEAAKEHRLVVQRCIACGYYNHPPRPFCDACIGEELRFEQVSGRGTVYTFTVMHQRDVAGFAEEAPFINIVVELAEQPRLLMVSNRPLSERAAIKIGAPVEVYFEDRGEGVVIPQFRIV